MPVRGAGLDDRRHLAPFSGGEEPSINGQNDPRDVRSGVTRQEHNGRGALVGRTGPTHRDPTLDHSFQVVVLVLIGHLGGEEPG